MDSTRYRKQPVEIDAVRLDETNAADVARWCSGDVVEQTPAGTFDVERRVQVATLEGTMVASVGDYVIRGVRGEYYPCKPDIFDATYQPVED